MNPFDKANEVKHAKQSTIRRGRMTNPEYAAGYHAGYEAGCARKKIERAEAKRRDEMKPLRRITKS